MLFYTFVDRSTVGAFPCPIHRGWDLTGGSQPCCKGPGDGDGY